MKKIECALYIYEEIMHHCDICGNNFADTSNHVRHVKMHLKIRPYECSVCEKKFTQSNNCKSHVSKGECALQGAVAYVNPLSRKQSRKLWNTLRRQGVNQRRGPYTRLKENNVKPRAITKPSVMFDLPDPLTYEDIHTFYLPTLCAPIEETMLEELNTCF